MDLETISDDELFSLALEENEDAKNIIYKRFKYIIDINLRKYGVAARILGVDWKDFEAEALYGFSDALACYRQDKPASIPTFINLCVGRRLNKCLLKASTLKNQMYKDAYSLDYVYEQFELPLVDLISDDNKNDPLTNMAKEESYNELLKMIKEELSSLENEVFALMVNGLNYQQIALILNKSPKQIDNTIQRLKVKLKNILELRKSTC